MHILWQRCFEGSIGIFQINIMHTYLWIYHYIFIFFVMYSCYSSKLRRLEFKISSSWGHIVFLLCLFVVAFYMQQFLQWVLFCTGLEYTFGTCCLTWISILYEFCCIDWLIICLFAVSYASPSVTTTADCSMLWVDINKKTCVSLKFCSSWKMTFINLASQNAVPHPKSP